MALDTTMVSLATAAAAILTQHPTTSNTAICNPNPNPQLISLMSRAIIQNEQFQQQRTYVSALVDFTVQVISSIWPNSISANNTCNNKPVADLNTFLHHILKHSRTTHSTLQLAIFYLFRIRSRVVSLQQESEKQDVYISCGRRMFLAALISAHKYLQDKTYKNSAWSKVSGLNVMEINRSEKVMLQLLDYRLYVKKDTYDQWISMLQAHLRLNSGGKLTATTATDIMMTAATTKPVHTNNATSALPSPPTSPQNPQMLEPSREAVLSSLPSPPLEEEAWIFESPSNNNRKRRVLSDVTDQQRAIKKRS